MKTKLGEALGFLYGQGKIDGAEVATIMAALDCLSYEIENKGPQSVRLIEEYGTQIHDGIKCLNKYL